MVNLHKVGNELGGDMSSVSKRDFLVIVVMFRLDPDSFREVLT